MEGALLEAIRSVPGLAFAAFVFWLISGLWQKALEEQRLEREAHRSTVDAVVAAFRESVTESIESADRRSKECSDRCLAAIESLRRG